MKKTLKLFGLVALSAFVFSCTKETALDIEKENITPADEQQAETPDNPVIPATDGGLLTSFGVTFEGQQDADTKVSINLGSGVTAIEDGDEVLVYVSETNKATYKYNKGKFEFSEGAPVTLDAPASVFYPAGEFNNETGVFTMPAAVTSLEDLGDKAPMAGQIEGSAGAYKVELKNLASVLKVGVTGATTNTLTSVTLAATGKSVAAGAAYTVDFSGTRPVLATEAADAASSMKVSVGGAALSGTAQTFFFLVPAGLSLGNVTVTATLGEDHNGGNNTFSISQAAFTPEAKKIIGMSFYAGLFSGGAGTEEDPYKIANARDFKYISKYCAEGYNPGNKLAASFLEANYQQTANIDIKRATLTPIGGSDARFSGVYDGNGKTISNVNIGGGEMYGLFGFTSNATIKDWTAENINVTGEGSNRGAFVGYMVGGEVNNCDIIGTSSVSGNSAAIGGIVGSIRSAKGIVTGCESTATVTNTTTTNSNNYATGGIVGLVYTGAGASEISNCSVSGNVSSIANAVGGIVGRYYIAGTLSNCSTASEMTVSGNGEVGGIVGGLNAVVDVTGCKNRATVVATGNNVGGIAGIHDGGSGIFNCWSNAEITGVNQTGGISGYLTYGVVKLCHAKGTVNGAQCVGGIVGHMYSDTNGKYVLIMECLANADINSSTGADSNSGGVVGRLHANYVNKNIQYSTVANCVGWSAKIKNTNTDACTRFGAFVGFVNTQKENQATNERCRVFNSYTSVATDDVIWLAGTPSKTGGFVGELQRGKFNNCYYQLDNNSQSATISSNNVWLTNFEKVNSDFANYLMKKLGVTTGQNLGGGRGPYAASEWTMTGYNGESLEYPLPSALVALGTEYYD